MTLSVHTVLRFISKLGARHTNTHTCKETYTVRTHTHTQLHAPYRGGEGGRGSFRRFFAQTTPTRSVENGNFSTKTL